MNDDRKFKAVAHKVKILFEQNIGYQIIAEILGIDDSTVGNYRRRAEKYFNCSFGMSNKKTGVYPRMLEIYARLYPSVVGGLPLTPDEELLFEVAVKIIKADSVMSAVEGAAALARILQAPKIESDNIIFRRYLRLTETVLEMQISKPSLNNDLIKKPWEIILQAIVTKKIDCQFIESAKELISVSVNFLAKNIDRQSLTTLTLKEEELVVVVDSLLQTLKRDEAGVLRQYFGLDGKAALGLSEIGGIYGLGKERIRQIKEKALYRLGVPSRKKVLLKIINNSETIESLREELLDEKNKNSTLVSRLESGWMSDKTDILTTRILHLNLSVRARNIAMNQGVEYLYEFIQLKFVDVLRIRNAGKKSLDEWTNFLRDKGLQFNTTFSDSEKAVLKAIIKQKHQ